MEIIERLHSQVRATGLDGSTADISEPVHVCVSEIGAGVFDLSPG